MTINLQPFCCKEGGRYDLGEPFVLAGWEYGGGPRIFVRVPSNEPDTCGRSVPKGIAELFAKADELTFSPWLPDWPDALPACQPVECPDAPPCKECNGTGGLTDDDGQPIFCNHCKARVQVCKTCGGLGHSLAPAYQLPTGLYVHSYYINLIRSLPGLAWAHNGNKNHPLYFRFDGGEGAVMGMAIEVETGNA